MIEKVARAISKAIEFQESLAFYPYEDRKEAMDEVARAAIDAMREPTQSMLAAGDLPGWDDSVSVGLSGEVWAAMIDAALSQAIGNKESGED